MAAVVGTAAAGAAAGKGTALLVSAGISAVGSLIQGFAANRAARFDAAILRQRAQQDRLVAERDADLRKRRLSALLATQRARRAGSGIRPREGSSLLVDDQSIAEIALSVETIRRQGQVSATRLEQQAALSRFGGRTALTAGVFGAGKSLLEPFIPRRVLTTSGRTFG